jgi:hypothetical protein
MAMGFALSLVLKPAPWCSTVSWLQARITTQVSIEEKVIVSSVACCYFRKGQQRCWKQSTV